MRWEDLGVDAPVNICIANCGQTVTEDGMVFILGSFKRYNYYTAAIVSDLAQISVELTLQYTL